MCWGPKYRPDRVDQTLWWARFNFTYFFADFQVRLNGSSLSSAGTINVLYYGVWGGIRGYNVDIRVGHVVCRQLGYSRAERIFSYASFGGVIGPLWIWRIQCNGNETEISQCEVETWDKIWNTSSYNWYDSFLQQPRYAASLLCNKANSSFSKGRYNLQRSCPSDYMRHKLHSCIFFASFFVVLLDYCLRPTDVFIYFLLAMCFFIPSIRKLMCLYCLWSSLILCLLFIFFLLARWAWALLVCLLGCLSLPALRYVFFSQTSFWLL